ncbi:MAG: phosphatase PAP2 family protein [Solirubrobacterales bacterium]
MALGLLLALVLAGWALGELSRSVLTMSDLDAVRDVASERSSQLTAIAHVLSAFGSGYVVAPLAVVVAVLLFARGRRTAALAIAVSTLGAAAISTSDKLLVGRPRPPVEHLEAVSTASFPSGHTTTAAAFYLALLIAWVALRSRRRTVLLPAATAACLLIIGVAVSRVYLGVHYPSDVVAGLLLGSVWSLLVGALMWPSMRASDTRNERATP